jgi:hypothetical protein
MTNLLRGSTWYRTNAYTFDHEVFAKWRGRVAGVWIKEREEETPDNAAGKTYCSAILQSPCNPTAHAEQIEKPDAGPDLTDNPYNTHLDLSNTLSPCKSEITQQPLSANVCSCDPGVAAHIDPNSAEQPQNSVTEQENPPNSVLHMQNTCRIVQHTSEMPPGELMVVGVKIHAIDYKSPECLEPHTPGK